VLLEDGCCRKRSFQAVCAPVLHDSTKRSESFTVPLPVVGQRAQELLYLPGRSTLLYYFPLLRPEGVGTGPGPVHMAGISS
jgi:hypothetical protein